MTTASLLGSTPRRNSELRLLIYAVAIAVAAYAALGLGHEEKLSGDALRYGGSLALLFGAAHLAVRRLAPAADPLLLPLAALLNGVGMVIVRRLDLAAIDRARQNERALPEAFAPKQLTWTLIAIVIFILVLAAVRDHRTLDRYRYTLLAIGLALLVVPAVPGLGSEINGARIWVRVGSVQFQPAEIAKLCLIAFFASYLVAKREVLSLATRRVAGINLPRARDLGPVLLAWLGSLLVLVREKDLGSSLLFFALFVLMLYVATERTSWVLIGVALFAVGTTLAYLSFSHVEQRVSTWLHPFADSANKGYQLTQALFGLGTGGLTGTGLGRGMPDTVPEARTDFVFAAIGEELGLIGTTAVLIVFTLIVARAIRTALGVRDDFGKLFATGLAIAVAVQVFVVVGGVTRLIPLTGITLPFVSYGGSSLVANWALVALLLRISDSGRTPIAIPVSPSRQDPDATGAMTQIVRR
jgi:cell division protein FtsW (lipid II flippase)